MPARKALVVRRGRQPHELGFAFACIIIGAIGLATLNASSTLARTFGSFATVWYFGAFIGGLVTTIGIMRGTISALLTERIGLCILSGICISYALSTVLLVGVPGIAAMAFVGAYGIASGVRVWQIGQDLDRFYAALYKPVPVAVVADVGDRE